MGYRGSAKARRYNASEPVFARENLKFSGRPVACRAQVPEEYFRSARDRRVMWEARKIDHAGDLPVKSLPPPPQAATVEPPPPASVQSPEAAAFVEVEITPAEAIDMLEQGKASGSLVEVPPSPDVAERGGRTFKRRSR